MEKKEQQANLMNVLSFVAEQTMALSKENTVVGAPIEKDGVTVIPISKLTVGFAGGGADLCDSGRKKEQHPAGGGAKVSLTPVSFLVIEGGEVRTIGLDIPEESPMDQIWDAVFTALKKKKEE